MNQDRIDISFVLPCYNEEESIENLTREIRAVMQEVGKSYEIMFINDCSTDRTPEVLSELEAGFPEVRSIHHSRNCGESAAQTTGFRFARGGIIITMDSDGQNDPADVPHLLQALEGTDCVAGVRRTREDDWIKRLSSRIANGFRNVITGDRLRDSGCTYRAIRKSVLGDIPVFNGVHRFLPTLLRFQGYRAVEISVNHRPRTTGVSKYGVGNRMFRGILDCLVMRWWRRRAIYGARADWDKITSE